MWLLWVLYLVGAGLEVAGLVTAGSGFLASEGGGVADVRLPSRRRVRISGALLLAGIAVGLAGNIRSMYVG